MRVMEQITTYSLTAAVILALSLSCVREQIDTISGEEVIITATASLPESRTKMVYEEGAGGIKAGWKTGDTFLALEINGSTVTPVTFTATASADVKASFVSSGAVEANSSTRWVAVLGKGASFNDGSISCSYAGQDGSLSGLEKCDYMVATSSGDTPDFNYGNGKHLTYVLRIKMPEGVGAMEFNTWAEGPEWSVGSDGSVKGCTADYRPAAAKLFQFAKETAAGENAYLAVPAVDYSDAGLIVTAFNSAGTQSQGKVLSADLSAKGGRVGTYEMDALIDRPLPEDALNFLTQLSCSLHFINNSSWDGLTDKYNFSTSPSWAPFNVGAKASPSTAEEAYGSYFAWGETEQRASYSHSSYKHDGKDGTMGYTRSHPGQKDIRLDLKVISGTKYDVARVKWGSAWRMPFLEEMLTFTGDNEIFSCSSGRTASTANTFKTIDVSEYKGVAVNGRTFSRNGVTVFFPFSGRYYYTEGSEAAAPSLVGKAGFYFGGVHNITAGRSDAYRLYVRGNQVDVLAEGCEFAYSVRPVLAQETDEPGKAIASGRVTDAVSGKGIAGVTVSDGYTCCSTDADGAYQMNADTRARYIAVTIPAAYEIPLGEDGRPAFYKLVDFSYGGETVADFSLTPRKEALSAFSLITVADAHVQTEDQLEMFKNGPFADIQKTVKKLESSGPVIGIALGDQLSNDISVSAAVREVYTGVKLSSGVMPFFYVIGNHDHEPVAGGTDDQSTDSFLHNFGPTDYSFDIGNAHIVVMDDIQFNGSTEGGSSGEHIKYSEGINGEQLHWLKEDMALVKDKANKVVLFCTHAPIYNPIMNVGEVKSMLNDFNEAHVFSGHLHNLTNYSHRAYKSLNGKPIFEHNMQSLSGQIWIADVSANGSPAGYGVYTFSGSSLSWEYNKTWKENENFQIRVYSGNDDYSGYSWDSEYRGKFLARVWDGDDPETAAGDETWTLNFIHNGESVPMTRLKKAIIDQCADSYYVETLHSRFGNWSKTSYTWWVIDAPGGDPAAVKNWKITATHKLPGKEKTYTESILSRDYTGYGVGTRFLWSIDENELDPGSNPDGGAVSPSLTEDTSF